MTRTRRTPPPVLAATPSPALPPSPTPKGVAGVVYGGIRLLHLLIVTASLPLGLFGYIMTSHPGAVSRVVVFGVALFLTFVALGLDQASYPVTIPAALLRTAPIVVALGVGLWSHEDLTMTAWRSVASFMTAFALSFALMSILASGVEGEKRAPGGAAIGMPIAFFGGIAALVVGWPLASPIVAALQDPAAAPITATGIAAVVAWLLQTAMTTKGWFAQSVFGGPRSPAQIERTLAMTRWGGVIAVMMMAAGFAFTVMAFW